MPPPTLDRTFGPAPNRVAPLNPRYTNARTKLDTGPNMRKVLDAYQGSGPNAHKKQRDEFFVRLRPHTLGRLLEPLVENEESIYQLGQEDTQSIVSSVVPESAGGGGSSEGNIVIFDLRPFEEFEQCHVYGARHLDVSTINRSTNNMPREVYFFKGPITCDKMVVLIDEDGKAARAYGNTFVERGVENTYVVNGGFLAICAVSPSILVGHPPSPETLAALMSRAGLKVAPSMGARGGAASAYSVRSERCSTAGSVRTQNTQLLSSIAGSTAGMMRPWK